MQLPPGAVSLNSIFVPLTKERLTIRTFLFTGVRQNCLARIQIHVLSSVRKLLTSAPKFAISSVKKLGPKQSPR